MADSCSTGEEVFLAERIIDSGFGQQDGKRYYKVKWVRYTWEAEDTLSHLKELVDLFWSEHGGVDSFKADKTADNSLSLKNDPVSKESEVKVQIQEFNKPEVDVVKVSDGEENALSVSVLLKENNEQESRVSELSPVTIVEQPIEGEAITTPNASEYDSKAVKYIIDKHTCDVCFRTYNSIQSLKSHKRSHLSDKSFQCDTCFKCFGERSTLKRHMFIHLEKKPFKCEHCDRAFSDKSTLRRHTITHTGDKRFHCSICAKRFTRNEHLRQHMYIHTAEKLYKCDICEKDFRQRSTLKNHMLLHRAESGLKCPSCGAVFMREVLYDKHVIWCNEDNRHGKHLKCEFCETFYTDEASLKNHQAIHSGDRPYKCIECNQTFTYKSILRRHILTHVEKKSLPCVVCNKEFVRKVDLISHTTAEHPEQPVYELLDTVDYNVSNNIQLDSQPNGIEQEQANVRYIIQNSDSLNEVEVSSASCAADISGISVLAQTVSGAVAHTHATAGVVSSVSGNPVPNNMVTQQHSGQAPLQLHLNSSTGIETVGNVNLQPGDDQLLQVQIIRMEDGNQFVQSIHAIVQSDHEKETHFSSAEVAVDDTEVIVNNETPDTKSDSVSGSSTDTIDTSNLNLTNEAEEGMHIKDLTGNVHCPETMIGSVTAEKGLRSVCIVDINKQCSGAIYDVHQEQMMLDSIDHVEGQPAFDETPSNMNVDSL